MVTGSEGSPRRRAASQLWPVLGVLACVAVLALLNRERPVPDAAGAEDEPAAWVDPAAARVERQPSWADPRWIEHLQAVCTRAEPALASQPEVLAPFVAELAALSFVERVERCELSPAGGLRLELALRQPVACIPVPDGVALVDEDGVVLEGRWPMPPRLGRAYLPVLGPADDALFARARAGDWLAEPEHEDALDVALSLAENLEESQRAELGPLWIDARRARSASVEEPGVRLELEGGRTAWFGRAPSCGEPGELAAARKWQGLARAVALFASDPRAHDWELVDLRWDRPELALVQAPDLAAATRPEPRSHRAESGSRARAADDSRPRVR